jgi:hypothetical protein
VSTKFIATVSIKQTYFHFKHNESFHHIEYILQSLFDNKYRGLLLYYKPENISITPVIALPHKNSHSMKPYYRQSNNYMHTVAKQVAVKRNLKATYTVMSQNTMIAQFRDFKQVSNMQQKFRKPHQKIDEIIRLAVVCHNTFRY